jgi:hypothetical protein
MLRGRRHRARHSVRRGFGSGGVLLGNPRCQPRAPSTSECRFNKSPHHQKSNKRLYPDSPGHQSHSIFNSNKQYISIIWPAFSQLVPIPGRDQSARGALTSAPTSPCTNPKHPWKHPPEPTLGAGDLIDGGRRLDLDQRIDQHLTVLDVSTRHTHCRPRQRRCQVSSAA